MSRPAEPARWCRRVIVLAPRRGELEIVISGYETLRNKLVEPAFEGLPVCVCVCVCARARAVCWVMTVPID